MDWYWNLSDLLLDKNRIEKSSAGLRDELEKHVVDLYQRLIAYQMGSVHSYYRNRGVVFFRDMIKLDDWDGQLKGIKDAEGNFRDDSGQYNTLQIYLALQRQTTQQKEMREDDEDKKFRKHLLIDLLIHGSSRPSGQLCRNDPALAPVAELHLPQETHLTSSHSCDQQPPPLSGLASIYVYIHIR
jgi:hypothetical protein